MEKLPLNWFNVQAHMSDDYAFINDNVGFIKHVEIVPLEITGTLKAADYDLWSGTPNAWGVYLRYTDEGVDYHNLNPSEWLADFNTEKAAKAFKQIIEIFIKALEDEHNPFTGL